MSDQDKIISFLRMTGPSLPAKVAKHINSNILLASAHLSELASQGKIRISHLKIGGSPLYYLPEQKEKLQNFSHNLNPKDQETLQKLKENKLLRENNLDLFAKVSLRNIKDFAVPLTVNHNNNKEIFWKWYLLDDQQATDLIKEHLTPSRQPASSPETAPTPSEEQSSSEAGSPPAPAPSVPQEPDQQDPPEPSPQYPKTEVQKETEPETKTTETEPSKIPSHLQGTKEESQQKLQPEQKEEKKFFQKIKEKLKPKRKEVPDDFFPQIESFFKERNITIQNKETLRKNSEMNFILEVPSVIGKLNYFCKAKNKKRCDEKDLSAAYMEAQTKKLPLFFIYTNEISKKAQEMLDSGAFDNLTIKRID